MKENENEKKKNGKWCCFFFFLYLIYSQSAFNGYFYPLVDGFGWWLYGWLYGPVSWMYMRVGNTLFTYRKCYKLIINTLVNTKRVVNDSVVSDDSSLPAINISVSFLLVAEHLVGRTGRMDGSRRSVAWVVISVGVLCI